jgi:hypothetical protein
VLTRQGRKLARQALIAARTVGNPAGRADGVLNGQASHLKQELEQLLRRPVDLVRLRVGANPAWQTTSTCLAKMLCVHQIGHGPRPRLSWNLRVTPEDQDLIDRAVSASGHTRTDFVL